MSRLSSLEVNLRLRMLLAVGCSLCFAAPQVWSQVTAHAAVAAASPDAQLKQLRQQLSALEGRVHELEKKADDVKNNDDDDAQAKKFEQRLAAIESEQRKLQSEAAGRERAEKEEPALSHAKAPFVVYDDEGHAIFRVELQVNTKSPRITVGNPVGARVVIGANDQIKSAAVLMFAGESADTQVLLLADKKSSLKLSSAASNQQTVLGSGADGGYGLFLSRGNVGSASLTSAGSGAGYLSIANSKGAIVAEGGSKPSGIGIFRTGPSCCTPPGAVGPHQYIVGRQE